jgi:hypothetical protein
MSRRAILLLTALGLLTANILFLGWRWHRDTVANAEITYVGLESLNMLMPIAEPTLSLKAGQWQLDGKPLADPAPYLRGLASRKRMPMVSAPTFGELPGVLRALKARKACNILIREGGSVLKTGRMADPPGEEMLDVQALVLCGNSAGDAGFYGTLPPDGPIRVSPAPSLR